MSKSPEKSGKSENTASPGRDHTSTLQEEIRRKDLKIEKLKKSYEDLFTDNQQLEQAYLKLQKDHKESEAKVVELGKNL